MNVKVRSAEAKDADRLLEIYAWYVEHTAITFEYDVPSAEEFRERIVNSLRSYPYLVLEKGGIIRGYAYAGVFKDRAAYDHSCEVTVYLDRTESGNGYGRALYGVLETELAARGFLNLYACIGVPEVPDEYLTRSSQEFHAHMGYRLIGEFHKCGYKFGRWYNMVWMEKFIGEHSVKHPETGTLSEAQKNPGSDQKFISAPGLDDPRSTFAALKGSGETAGIPELVKKNRSCRGYNHDRVITREELLELADCARLCASSVNVQPLKYYLAWEKEEVDRIQPLTGWAKGLPERKLPHPGMEPTAFIIICQDMDIHASPAAFQKDVGIAAQTMLLAAVEKGLGGCMIGSFSPERIAGELSLPENIKPLLIVAFGEPAEKVVIREIKSGESTAYYRDDEDVHYVPKRRLEDVVLTSGRF